MGKTLFICAISCRYVDKMCNHIFKGDCKLVFFFTFLVLIKIHYKLTKRFEKTKIMDPFFGEVASQLATGIFVNDATSFFSV